MILTYIVGSLSLVVFLAAVALVQLGFVITFAIILILFVPIIAGVILLYAFITRVRQMARFG